MCAVYSEMIVRFVSALVLLLKWRSPPGIFFSDSELLYYYHSTIYYLVLKFTSNNYGSNTFFLMISCTIYCCIYQSATQYAEYRIESYKYTEVRMLHRERGEQVREYHI